MAGKVCFSEMGEVLGIWAGEIKLWSDPPLVSADILLLEAVAAQLMRRWPQVLFP